MQKGTLDTVLDILREGHEAAPHLSYLGSSHESLRRQTLMRYKSHCIKRQVALHGGFVERLRCYRYFIRGNFAMPMSW